MTDETQSEMSFQDKFEEAIGRVFNTSEISNTTSADRIAYVFPSGKNKVTGHDNRFISTSYIEEVDDDGNTYMKRYQTQPQEKSIVKPLYFVVDANGEVMLLTWRRAKSVFSPRQARMALKRTRRVVREYEDHENATEEDVVEGLKQLIVEINEKFDLDAYYA